MSKIHRYTLITIVALILLLIVMLVLCANGRTIDPSFRTRHGLASMELCCLLYYDDRPGQRPTAEILLSALEEDRKRNGDLVTTFQIANEQPLKDFGIMKLAEKECQDEYLYTNKVPESNLPEDSIYIYACGAAAKEKPEGNYWSYKIKKFSDHWVVGWFVPNTRNFGVWLIRSSVPPVPGCYFIGEEQLYYPDRAAEALRAYYPNASLEKGHIAKIEEVRKLWPSGQMVVSPNLPQE